MKTTRYTIASRKVVALALVLVLLATMFVGCNGSKDEETTTTTTTTEVQTTIEIVTEIVTNEDGETVTDDNGEVLTTEVTKVVEIESQSGEDKNEKASSKQSDSTTSTTKANTTTTTTKKNTSNDKTETTTKKNTSTGSSNKVTTTKPMVTTTVATCKHNYELVSYTNGCYVYYCSKCDHYESEEREMNPDDFMGSKSEYLELLGYVNEARREAGLNELVYLDEFQNGSDIRAKDLTIKFSHDRPNGNYGGEVFSKSNYWNCGENIYSGSSEPSRAFNRWMGSEGHKTCILNPYAVGFVASRCDGYWVMNIFGKYMDE